MEEISRIGSDHRQSSGPPAEWMQATVDMICGPLTSFRHLPDIESSRTTAAPGPHVWARLECIKQAEPGRMRPTGLAWVGRVTADLPDRLHDDKP